MFMPIISECNLWEYLSYWSGVRELLQLKKEQFNASEIKKKWAKTHKYKQIMIFNKEKQIFLMD